MLRTCSVIAGGHCDFLQYFIRRRFGWVMLALLQLVGQHTHEAYFRVCVGRSQGLLARGFLDYYLNAQPSTNPTSARMSKLKPTRRTFRTIDIAAHISSRAEEAAVNMSANTRSKADEQEGVCVVQHGSNPGTHTGARAFLNDLQQSAGAAREPPHGLRPRNGLPDAPAAAVLGRAGDMLV